MKGVSSVAFIALFVSGAYCAEKIENRAGGWRDADVTSPTIQETAKFAFASLEEGCNCLYRNKMVEILSARQQVVAGMKTRLVIQLAPTKCRKGKSQNDIEECELHPGLPSKICTVEVWEKPWEQFRKVLSSNCEEQEMPRTKRKIGGDDHDFAHMGMFKDFMVKFNKTYTGKKELKYRFEVFRRNMKTVKQLNAGEQADATYGITFFADYTEKEFKHYFTGLRPDLSGRVKREVRMAKIPNVRLPKSFDWRDRKVVTPVKNQGMCGSCWAFSTTGNVEGQWAIAKGQLVSLSEQELVDCDKIDQGCEGGLMTNAFEDIIQLGGLEGETDYPYKGSDENCNMKKPLIRASISGYVNVSTNETEMAQFLTKNGPIAVGINANAMQFYMGGVSHPWKFLCNPTNLDHGVLIVGFGETHNKYFNKTTPYWIIKNSWGPHWGEQGYYRVYRGDGTCGVNQMASSATI